MLIAIAIYQDDGMKCMFTVFLGARVEKSEIHLPAVETLENCSLSVSLKSTTSP